jgi:hypothetical protein
VDFAIYYRAALPLTGSMIVFFIIYYLRWDKKEKMEREKRLKELASVTVVGNEYIKR